MRKACFAAAAGLALFVGPAAQAEEGERLWLRVTPQMVVADEIGLEGGGLSGSAEFGTGWGIGATLGYDLSQWFAAALDVGYARVPYDSITVNGVGTADVEGDSDVLVGYLNGYVRPLQGDFQLYLGGGIGLSHIRSEVTEIAGLAANLDDSDTRFGFNVTAGAEWAVNDVTALGAGYRLYWIDGDDGIDDLTAHGIGATVTVRF